MILRRGSYTDGGERSHAGSIGDGSVPGVELEREQQQVDLSKAARWHPLTPSGMHFPGANGSSSSSSTAGLQQLKWSDSVSHDPAGQHLSNVA